MLLAFAPAYCIFLLAVFALVLYLTSMISFASVVAAVVGLITILIFPAFHFLLYGYDLLFSVILILVALLIIIRHKDNMIRIKNHTENTIPFGLNLTKQNMKD